MKLLHLDSSITGENSVSRTLTAAVTAAQIEQNPGVEIVYHDLAAEPLLHLSPNHLAAFGGAAVDSDALGEDLAVGGQYLEELFAADVLVIGTPMYNFTIPTQLKSWIDRIVVAGRTFRYTENGPVGLLPPGKKAYIVASTGGIYSGDSPIAQFEHTISYLSAVLAYIGIAEIIVIRAEGIGLGPDARDQAIDAALHTIRETAPVRQAA